MILTRAVYNDGQPLIFTYDRANLIPEFLEKLDKRALYGSFDC